MKRRLRVVLFIAAITGVGVILFQAYWLYKAWHLNRDSFVKTAGVALQRSIDDYYLQNWMVGDNSRERMSPPLSMMMVDKDSVAHSKQMPIKDGSIDLGVFELLMAQAMFQIKSKTVQLDSISSLYKSELKKDGIGLEFRLLFSDTVLSPVAASISVSGKKAMVYAVFSGSNSLILSRTVMAIVVSLLLVAMTAGCLWYMLRVIGRQRQLDEIKNDFINNMTHELRTPIALLKSTHEALLSFGRVDDREKTLQYLYMNVAELDKLEGKVDRILEITHLETGSLSTAPDWMDLRLILRQVVDRYGGMASILFDYRLDESFVQMDTYAIDVILSNLLDNAIKYSGDRAAEIGLTVTALGEGWQLEVKDNGIGIEERYLSLIFDKFFRVPTGKRHDVKGYGIGLSYVRQLVDVLEGSIDVQSQKGIGSTFTVKFPQSWKK